MLIDILKFSKKLHIYNVDIIYKKDANSEHRF